MSKNNKKNIQAAAAEIGSSSTLTQQMADMRRDGYTVLPSSFADGYHSQFEGMNVLNFAGHAHNPLLSRGRSNGGSDAVRAAGGFTATGSVLPTPRDKDGNEIGTPGKGYIAWGPSDNLPNIVALVNSQLVYTALCVKHNVDILCGLGVTPIYEYHSTVGCNENEDQLNYRHAGSYLQRRIEQARSKMFNLLKEHEATPSESKGESGKSNVVTTAEGVPMPTEVVILPYTLSTLHTTDILTHPSQRPATVPEASPEGDPAEPTDDGQLDIAALHAPDGLGYKRYADGILDDMIRSHRATIKRMEKEYRTWARTNSRLQQFDRNYNAARFAHGLATDLVQFNIGFVEIDLSQDATRQRDTAQWRPTIVGLRHRNAMTCRLEEKDDMGVSRYVYISNRWLNPSDITEQNPLTHSDMSALPALDPDAPLTDLTARIRQYRSQAASAAQRLANFDAAHPELASEDATASPEDANAELLAERAQLAATAAYYADPANRPCRFILPVDYSTAGRHYYPQPAYWSIYKDIYAYADNIIRDRAIRKQNENMFTYVVYVHQGYLNQLANQENAQKTEDEKKAIKQREIDKIKNFISNKQNNGSTLSACTFVGQDGKDHDAFRIERIDYANTKNNAEADKTEITDLASLICFGFECHPDLIGATPGVSSNGGTYQREMLLINQAKKANLQQLMLAPYALLRDFNGLDPLLDFKIRQRVLTTLDASKTGMTDE